LVDVEETLSVDVGGSHALIHRAIRGAIVGVVATSRTALMKAVWDAHARLAPGFQPEMVPSSVAKMKTAGKTGRRVALVQEEISGAAIDDDPSGSGLRAAAQSREVER